MPAAMQPMLRRQYTTALDSHHSWSLHALALSASASASASEAFVSVRPYAADLSSAAVSALMCAPLISGIDRAITTNASGVKPFWPALRESTLAILTQPRAVIRGAPFRWLALVYGATYGAANLADTYSRRNLLDNAKVAVLASSTTANTAATIAKDRAFAQLFGASAPRPVPMPTYGIWGGRDLLTMAFAFTVPPLASDAMQDRLGVSPKTANVVATLAVPCVAQLVAAPLHLLGLNLYNEPTASLAQRLATVRSQALTTILAKSMRVFAAFSLAGLVNKELRVRWSGP